MLNVMLNVYSMRTSGIQLKSVTLVARLVS